MTSALDIWRQVRRADGLRPSVPSVPGEHWASLGAGMALVRAGSRMRSPLWRALAWAAAAALVVRALSGRDGVAERVRRGQRL